MGRRRLIDSHALIVGLLAHQEYPVMARQMGVSPRTVQQTVARLLHTYQAQDRYELEYKLERLFGEQAREHYNY